MISRKKKETTYPMTSLKRRRTVKQDPSDHCYYHGTMGQTSMILLERTDGNSHHQ
jgi:hypothetical protein